MNSGVYTDIGTSVWRRAFLAGAVLAVLLIVVLTARWRPLWYEELFTLQVVSESSLAAAVPLVAGLFAVHGQLRRRTGFGPAACEFGLPAAGGSESASTHLELQVRSRFRR